MPELHRTLILDVSFSSDSDLSTWAPILRLGRNDEWILRGKDAAVAAPRSFNNPRIRLCPYLNEELTIKHPELSVFIIVQGLEGAILAKMVLKDDVEQLGSQIFFEASNGFSVAFSGVMRKEDTKKLGNVNLSIKMAEKLSELLDQPQQNSVNAELMEDQDSILVLC